ncbi:MAG: hypothetical protein HHJ12_12275 [Glaciimonas sp.]|nr:hypothetical protein [Glaciimonas sp.]
MMRQIMGILFKIIGLLLLLSLTSCSKPVPPENNPLMEPVKALEQARSVENQIMQHAEQQKRRLEDAEK